MRGKPMAQTWSRRAVLKAIGGAATLVAAPRTGNAAIAAPPAPEPDFLRMLAFVPDRADLVANGVTFADIGAVKRLYGFAHIRSPDDLRRIRVTDFTNALSGCYIAGNEVQYAQLDDYRDLFGYDFHAIDREISVGQPPNLLPRREGVFDPDAIAAKLRDGGYATVDYRGATYAAKGGDHQLGPLTDRRARLALARLNRVAADRGRLITANATNLMESALDAEAGRVPVLAMNPVFRALALALGDVTSAAILDATGITPDPASVLTEAYRAYLREQVRDWNALRPALLDAMGYTDRGGDERVMHVARVYANPDDAAADASELERRIAGYTLARTQQPLIPTYATGVTTRAEAHDGLGVLVADVALTRTPVSARIWLQMYLSRDTRFLVPDPARLIP